MIAWSHIYFETPIIYVFFPHASPVLQAGQVAPDSWKNKLRHKQVRRLLALGLLAAMVIGIFYVYYTESDVLKHIESFVNEHPYQGAFVFVLLGSVTIACLMPMSIVAVAAGSLFGLGGGIFLGWLAAFIGQTIAFLLGRHLFQDALRGVLFRRSVRGYADLHIVCILLCMSYPSRNVSNTNAHLMKLLRIPSVQVPFVSRRRFPPVIKGLEIRGSSPP